MHQTALDIGADVMEFGMPSIPIKFRDIPFLFTTESDVRLTKDNVLVVYHDSTVDRYILCEYIIIQSIQRD